MKEIESIGRLIKTLKDEFCEECKTTKLQLRVRDDIHLIDGENVIQKNNYHYCNRCDILTKIKNKKFDRGREWAAIEIIPEPEPVYKKRDWKKK